MSQDGATVLLVEDDRFVRRATEATLRKGRLTVVVASDGEQALTPAGTAAPDLILLDVIMPKIQGFEVLRRLKDNPATRDIPVVLLSNLGQDGDVERARAGMRVTADELRALLVYDLDVIDDAEFDRACAMAARLHVPLEAAVVGRGRIPLAFLLDQLAQAWGVRFIDLQAADVEAAALATVGEDAAAAGSRHHHGG